MYGSKKSLKAFLVALLAVVLLANAVMPVTVMGSSNDTSTDYQYYVIKSGDSLTGIAKKYNVSASDIMLANKLSNADKLYAGRVIKIPLSSATEERSWFSTRLTLNLNEADVRDALTAIARNAGYTVIFDGQPSQKVTVNLENVSPLKAVDYVTRLADLSYLKDGNTIMVGTAADLNSTFVDKVVMTKFKFKYITVDTLKTQAGSLGLENVQYVDTPQDSSTVYISAYPKELAKIKELIDILDVSSNITAGATLITSNFTSIQLENIDATEFSGLLANLGMDAGIVLASRPYTLYTYVTGAALADIKAIKSIVDKPLTGKNLTSSKQEVVENTTAPGEPTTSAQQNNNNNSGNSGSTSTPSTPGSTTTQENTILREIALEYIDRAAAVEILGSFPYDVTVYGPEKMTKKIWLMGTESEVNKAEGKIKEFDTESYANSLRLENQFFIYDLKNCTAQEMLDRLANIDVGDVTFKTNAYPTVSKALIVCCEYSRQEQIKALLDALDAATTSEIEYRAVESTVNASIGRSRIEALRITHPEIPATAEFQFVSVTSKTGDTTTCTTYVKATPEMVDYIKALLAEMDAA